MATQKGRNWSSGDIVTAANLSSIERGVSAVSSLYEPTTWANGDTVTAMINAILYKGYAFASIGAEGDYGIEVEGNAEADGVDITITGDCTITISSGGASPK